MSLRIDKVESVVEVLFDEWFEELEKYENVLLKWDSVVKFCEIKCCYVLLMMVMCKVESKMLLVLSVF